jgi:Domain of unknown function (DUF4384)
MRRARKPLLNCGELTFAVLLTALFIPLASAQPEDNSRGVRIIEQPVSRETPVPPSDAQSAPPLANTPKAARPGELDTLTTQTDLSVGEVANPSELSVEFLPGQEISVGSRVWLRISTKKPGYLILLDIDAAGKLTQIFPEPTALIAKPVMQNTNYVRPGKSIEIPNPMGTHGFELVASPPTGASMVVAILSNRPVQVVDLPDIPAAMVGQRSGIGYLSKLVSDLRIPKGDQAGNLQEASWSLAAKFYRIR